MWKVKFGDFSTFDIPQKSRQLLLIWRSKSIWTVEITPNFSDSRKNPSKSFECPDSPIFPNSSRTNFHWRPPLSPSNFHDDHLNNLASHQECFILAEMGSHHKEIFYHKRQDAMISLRAKIISKLSTIKNTNFKFISPSTLTQDCCMMENIASPFSNRSAVESLIICPLAPLNCLLTTEERGMGSGADGSPCQEKIKLVQINPPKSCTSG